MPDWIEQLRCLLAETSMVTMVTVTATQGSAPRKIGARMLLTTDRQLGTIGGGNLEFSAAQIARDRRLANTDQPHRQKFALGPTLGQCCGGAVELLFETIESNTLEFKEGADWVCRRIDDPASLPVRLASDCDYQTKLKNVLDATTKGLRFTLVDTGGEVWACDKVTDDAPVVVVFGAGHVGAAVVAQLSLLGCSIVWVDERAGIFPAELAPQVRVVVNDCPADEVSLAVDEAWFIVLTHSHSTDFDICKAILEKQRFSFLGLIGSQTKRTTFRNRLAHRGVGSEWIERLCCPIGIEGIRSNHPEVIALSVAAQLTMLWESKTNQRRIDH